MLVCVLSINMYIVYVVAGDACGPEEGLALPELHNDL